jgi:hypothetical protein
MKSNTQRFKGLIAPAIAVILLFDLFYLRSNVDWFVTVWGIFSAFLIVIAVRRIVINSEKWSLTGKFLGIFLLVTYFASTIIFIDAHETIIMNRIPPPLTIEMFSSSLGYSTLMFIIVYILIWPPGFDPKKPLSNIRVIITTIFLFLFGGFVSYVVLDHPPIITFGIGTMFNALVLLFITIVVGAIERSRNKSDSPPIENILSEDR